MQIKNEEKEIDRKEKGQGLHGLSELPQIKYKQRIQQIVGANPCVRPNDRAHFGDL